MGFTGYLDGFVLDCHFYSVNSSDPWSWEIFWSSNIFFNSFFSDLEFCHTRILPAWLYKSQSISTIWGYWERCCFPEFFCVPMSESLVLVILLEPFFLSWLVSSNFDVIVFIFSYILFWPFFKSQWINDTRVMVKNWSVTYTCRERECQFCQIKWHWGYQPLQDSTHVQKLPNKQLDHTVFCLLLSDYNLAF